MTTFRFGVCQYRYLVNSWAIVHRDVNFISNAVRRAFFYSCNFVNVYLSVTAKQDPTWPLLTPQLPCKEVHMWSYLNPIMTNLTDQALQEPCLCWPPQLPRKGVHAWSYLTPLWLNLTDCYSVAWPLLTPQLPRKGVPEWSYLTPLGLNFTDCLQEPGLCWPPGYPGREYTRGPTWPH